MNDVSCLNDYNDIWKRIFFYIKNELFYQIREYYYTYFKMQNRKKYFSVKLYGCIIPIVPRAVFFPPRVVASLLGMAVLEV